MATSYIRKSNLTTNPYLVLKSLQQFIHISSACTAKKSQITDDESFLLLGLKKGCSQREARSAFIDLAKKYHPDSGKSTADPEKFSQIEFAYRNVADYLARAGNDNEGKTEKGFNEEADLDLKEFDIRHTAPQHRLVGFYSEKINIDEN